MPTLSPLPNRTTARQREAAWIQALLEAFPGPRTMGSAQSAARAASRLALESFGVPGARDEAWRFTDLSLLRQLPPQPLAPATRPERPLPPPGPASWRLSLDAWPLSPDTHWPEGIEPMSEAELEPWLGQAVAPVEPKGNWSVHLNNAIAETVIALRVRGAVSTTLELVSDSGGASGAQAFRILLVLEEGASLQLLQAHRADGPSLTSVVLEAFLQPSSTLRHGLVTRGTDSAAFLAVTAARQAPGSQLVHTSVGAGWGLARHEPVILQSQGQATTELRGLHWARGRQIADTHSRVRFEGPEGTLDQLHKVVAEAEGHSVFNGCVEVPRPAQRTNASQLSRGLLLSDQARIDTKPELQIVADDVRCTHGATISRLRPDELFYLRSRGIDGPLASRLLLRAFCEEVVAQLPLAAKAWNPLSPLLEEAPSR